MVPSHFPSLAKKYKKSAALHYDLGVLSSTNHVILELQEVDNVVAKLVFTEVDWHINGIGLCVQVKKLVASLNVQIDNRCMFLPQVR